MTKQIRHSLNYDNTKSQGELFTLPSMTVPDMAMTPQEILQRFAQGRPLSLVRDLVYTGDDYLPDPRSLDLYEREELIAANNDRIQQLQDELAEKRRLRKELKQKQKEGRESPEEPSDTDGGKAQ